MHGIRRFVRMIYGFGTEQKISADQKRIAEDRIDALLLERLDSGAPIAVTQKHWEQKKRRLTERLGKTLRPQ
jgi:hypothetical protein